MEQAFQESRDPEEEYGSSTILSQESMSDAEEYESQELVLQLELETPAQVPQQIIKSEVNLLKLPFFALSRRDATKKQVTEYRAAVSRGKQKLEVSWVVSANARHGYPGPFDHKVFRAVEQIISNMHPPIENPIPLGPISQIAKLMGIKVSEKGKPPGKIYEDIKKSLKRITMTGVESRGAFYLKGTRGYLDRAFTLYDQVVFAGELLENAEMAETNYLYLGSWYLENINNRYVRPLNHNYYRSLKSSVASRLYELLGVKFYGMASHKYIRFRYSTLCQLLPLTRQKYFSQAKQKMHAGHDELLQTGFFARVDWADIPSEGGDWYVIYWPGPRAIEELQGLPRQLELTPEAARGAPAALEALQEEVQPTQSKASRKKRVAKAIGDPRWQEVLEHLKGQLTRPAYETWLNGTSLQVQGNLAVISVPSRFVAEQLERRLYGLIQSAVQEVLGQGFELEFATNPVL